MLAVARARGPEGALSGYSWDLATHQRTWVDACRLQDAPHYKRADMSPVSLPPAAARFQGRGAPGNQTPASWERLLCKQSSFGLYPISGPWPWDAKGPAQDAVLCAGRLCQRRGLGEEHGTLATDARQSLIGEAARAFQSRTAGVELPALSKVSLEQLRPALASVAPLLWPLA